MWFQYSLLWRLASMFVFYCVVSKSLYCRVCLFILWGSNFVDFVSFLSMIIYEVLYTLSWCLKYNICSAWFLDITISTCSACLYINFYNKRNDRAAYKPLKNHVILTIKIHSKSIHYWGRLLKSQLPGSFH